MSGDELLDLLVRSRLVDAATLRRILPLAPDSTLNSGESLAGWLVERQTITAYQSRKLLRGVHKGLVHDSFELREVLGKGGMGTVYLAWCRQSNQYYAIKMLSAEQSQHERGVLRFRREIEVAWRLEHPRLASAHAEGMWRGSPFLAMEFVPGPTLYQLVQRQGPMPPYWAGRWIAEIADALDYAHQGGVVHRDMKPSNVIITPAGGAKLLDLGLARWFEDDHNEERVLGRKRIVGSFDYIAPEQAADSSRADARSDLYSLGCVMYFLLTGHPPFHHVSERNQKVACHRTMKATSVTVFQPGIPIQIVKVVERMMQKDPVDRYSVAAEVREVLTRWCDRIDEERRLPELPASWLGTIPAPPVDRGYRGEAEVGFDREGGFWRRLGAGLNRLFGG